MTLFILIGMSFPPKRLVLPVAFDDIFMDRNAREDDLAFFHEISLNEGRPKHRTTEVALLQTFSAASILWVIAEIRGVA